MEADTYNCGSHETDCTEGDKKFVSLGNVASVFRALNKIVARRRDAKSHDGFIKVLRPEAIPQLLKHRQFIELKALVRDVLNLDMVVMPVDGGCTVEFRKI